MDLEDLESNLNALRQLYGLVRKDGSLWNLLSDLLDDKSRLLLKDLLDLAAEKISRVHSEVAEGHGGLSLAKCSNNALQHGEEQKKIPPALLNPPETLTVIHSRRSNLDDDFTQFNREYRLTEAASQRTLTKPIQSVTATKFGHRHKYCRICQRRIARNSTGESTISDTRKGVKAIPLPHQENNQSNYFSWQDKKRITATTELSESRSTAKSKRSGTTGLDCTSSGIGSTDSCSNTPATAPIESESAYELTGKSTQENKDLDNLSKEASDVIKQIEMYILDLQRGSRNPTPSGNTMVPMYPEAQEELPDKEDSTCSVVLPKSLPVTGSEPSLRVLSTRCRNGPLNEVENGQWEDKGPKYQLPSRATGSSTEMKLLNLTASQPLKLLPPAKTMASPVSSQTNGKCTGLAACHYVQHETGNLSEEIKGQNQMEDSVFIQNINSNVAKIESMNETTGGNCLMPTQIDNSNSSQHNGNKISNGVLSLATSLTQQKYEEDLHQNQMFLEDSIIKPRTCQTSRVSKDYMNSQNIQALDSRCEVNQTWFARSKNTLPLQINKGHPSLEYKPEHFSPLLTSNSKLMDKDQVGVQSASGCRYPSRNILQHQDESDDTSFSSNSSNWTSQQISMSNSDNGEYYLPGEIQKQNYTNSPTSGENMYSPHPSSQGHFVGESCSDVEIYSWSSSDGTYPLTSYSSYERLRNTFPTSASSDQVLSIGDSDSESEDYSMYNQPRVRHYRQPRYLSVGSTYKKFTPTRVYKSDKGMNSNKPIGRWKKLKDKLSIIFHHHHHHHHHHHNHPDADDPSNQETRMDCGKFGLKHTVKTSCPTRTKAYGEQTLEKLGKSAIHNRDRKNQNNHFNVLVGGLFKHIRHSKESQPSAKHIKRFRKGHQEDKKASAKLHWWQLLQRHGRVKKLGLGYGKR